MTINSKRFFCVVSARSDNAIWGQTPDPMLRSDPRLRLRHRATLALLCRLEKLLVLLPQYIGLRVCAAQRSQRTNDRNMGFRYAFPA